jgi:hypothetical protein
MRQSSTPALNRARRLAGMGLAEIGYRTRQASAKFVDRVSRHELAEVDATAVGEVQRHLIDRLFAGLRRESIEMVQRDFAVACDEVIARADAALTGHFDLLGYRGLWFGDPIDWHVDPVHGRRAPQRHWSRIDPLDPESVGDSKVVWELNRHQWIVHLGQAFAFTRDERYAAAAIHAIDDWIAANPMGIGINWASSLEVAFRLIAWTWTLALLRDSATLTPEALARVVASIHAHAAHVEKYLSVYYSPNTHLTGEALGLFYAGVCYPEFREARRWRTLGSATLIQQADVQLSDDGVYFEQSTCYQRYTCDFYLHFLILAARNRIDVPHRIRTRVAAAVDALIALRRPDGRVPPIGDADGGQLLPLAVRAPGDCRGIFATAAALFGYRDFADAAAGVAPEVVWLLGPDGAAAFTRARATHASAGRSRILPIGGYAVMRSGEGSEAHQMIVDAGPIGSFGHGHADLLSIQCSVFGDECLVDPGTCAYTGSPEWRDYFRGTSAHNTVRLDSRNQADPAGPFQWQQQPSASMHEWRSTADFDLVDAQHSAYSQPGAPIVHRRRVLFVKPECWIVIDDLTGAGTHAAEWSFQFAPLPVVLVAGNAARADLPGGAACWMVPFASMPFCAALHTAETTPIRGWVSPDYGRRVPAPMLVYRARGPLPMQLVTVIYPSRRLPAAPPAIEADRDDGGRLRGLRIAASRAAVYFDPPVRIERG